MSCSEELEKVRIEAALFRQGWGQRLASHKILNPELYAANQGKQTKFTEATLLARGGNRSNSFRDEEPQSVEIIHKGDTRPLLFARQNRKEQPTVQKSSKRELEAESKKRSGDIFFSAGRYDAALATYVDVLRLFDEGDFAVQVRMAASDAALKSGDAEKAETFADAALRRAAGEDDGDSDLCDALLLRRGVARLVGKKWFLADQDLLYECRRRVQQKKEITRIVCAQAKCVQTQLVAALRAKVRGKALAAGVALPAIERN